MGTIYNTPKSIQEPKISWAKDSRTEIEAKENKFLADLKDFCTKRNPNKEHIGEVIKFPAADGYALYMVANLSPVELIHVPLGDAWEFQYANRLTKSDIIQQINNQKRLEALFSERTENNG